MLRLLVLVVLLLGTSTARGADIPTFLIPSPLGMVLQIGKWVLQNNEQVYQVTVRGIGADAAQAREQAFRLAVQEAVGSLMLSRTEVASGQVRRHEILNYSSGYVDRFEILKQDRDERGIVSVDMRVWVRRSTLADGLFGSSDVPNDIDRDRIQANVKTLRQERQTSEQLLRAVFEQWPRGSFRVTVKSTQWEIDSWGQTNLLVDLQIDWNEAWLRSVGEVITKTSGVPEDNPCRVELNRCSSPELYFVAVLWRQGYWGLKNVGAWPDRNKLSLIADTLGQGIMLRVEVLGDLGQVIRKQCLLGQQMIARYIIDNTFNLVTYSNQGVRLLAWGNQIGKIKIQDVSDRTLDDVKRIRVSVVPRENCQ